MSFYQPSLSLYDVLNALSDKAGVMGDGRRQNNIRGQRYTQRSPYPTNQRRNPGYIGSERRTYPSNRYYYTVPSTSYYQPAFVPNEEVERPQLDSFYTQYPLSTLQPSATQHSRFKERRPGYYGGDDLIEALLGALVGDQQAQQSSENVSEDDGEFADTLDQNGDEENGDISQEEHDAEGLLNSAMEAVADVPQSSFDDGTAAEAKSSSEDKTDRDAQGQGKAPERPELQAESSSSNKEQSKKSKTSKAPLRDVSSPIPVALQVSNPEIRLDMPFSPEVNVYETPEQYVVVLALPGASSKEFHIDYHPSTHEMLIQGTVQNKICVDEKYAKISELKTGQFKRSVKFPVLPRIKDEEIKASYSNGLLQIKVPKLPLDSQNPKPKKRILIEDIPDEELEFESASHNLPEE